MKSHLNSAGAGVPTLRVEHCLKTNNTQPHHLSLLLFFKYPSMGCHFLQDLKIPVHIFTFVALKLAMQQVQNIKVTGYFQRTERLDLI